jgi:hypothetical protein
MEEPLLPVDERASSPGPAAPIGRGNSTESAATSTATTGIFISTSASRYPRVRQYDAACAKEVGAGEWRAVAAVAGTLCLAMFGKCTLPHILNTASLNPTITSNINWVAVCHVCTRLTSD